MRAFLRWLTGATLFAIGTTPGWASGPKDCPNVVKLEALDERGRLIETSTAFHYPGSNRLIAAHHAIDRATSLQATTASGITRRLKRVLVRDPKNDLALLAFERRQRARRRSTDATSTAQIPAQPMREQEANPTTVTIRSWVPGLGFATIPARYLGQTVALGRPVVEIEAPVIPGMSGGPVVDHRCRLIGVVSFGVVTDQVVNYATPAAQIQDLLQRGS